MLKTTSSTMKLPTKPWKRRRHYWKAKQKTRRLHSVRAWTPAPPEHLHKASEAIDLNQGPDAVIGSELVAAFQVECGPCESETRPPDSMLVAFFRTVAAWAWSCSSSGCPACRSEGSSPRHNWHGNKEGRLRRERNPAQYRAFDSRYFAPGWTRALIIRRMRLVEGRLVLRPQLSPPSLQSCDSCEGDSPR